MMEICSKPSRVTPTKFIGAAGLPTGVCWPLRELAKASSSGTWSTTNCRELSMVISTTSDVVSFHLTELFWPQPRGTRASFCGTRTQVRFDLRMFITGPCSHIFVGI